MNQKKHLITYGDDKYKNSMSKLISEALNTEWFDTIESYNPNKLSKDFRERYKNILSFPKGGGYWIWKFDVIRQRLNQIADEDILIYLDAGCSVNNFGEQRFFEYVNMLNTHDEDIISFQMNHIEYKYTTKEIFNYFNIDFDNKIQKTGQIVGGILIMKKSDKLLQMFNKCFELLEYNSELITDIYNKDAQHPEFKDNRHDQSILSICRKIYGSIILLEETYFEKFGDETSLKYPFWATRRIL